MSSENGSDPTSTPSKASSHHAGNGHKGKQSGLNADFRYLNKNGKSFQGVVQMFLMMPKIKSFLQLL